MNTQDILANLLLIPVVLISLSVHEYAHALVANIFGDTTAKDMGRQTINPLAHWDPIGTTLLVVLLLLRSFGLGFVVFGWGKPVPVDERNLTNPRIHGLQVALAGPISNYILAVIFAVISHLPGLPSWTYQLLASAVFLNIFLMFFNLIPIPPLDGSRLLRLIMSDELYFTLFGNPVVMIILILVAFSFLLNYLGDISLLLSNRLITF